jgi:2,4-dienoyl-CoA reductase-like NADH-dependent reductase (Old Yellow Enzyme family)
LDRLLFTPTRLGEVAIANRVVMAPMTRNAPAPA